jgi:Mrp family chromosome partitioning ATPase
MGRMLKALQQIDVKRTAAAPPPAGDEVRRSADIEATLAEAENAVAAVEAAVTGENSAAAIEQDPSLAAAEPGPGLADAAPGEHLELARTLLGQLPAAGPAVLLWASPDGIPGPAKSLLSLAAALRQDLSGAVLLAVCDGRAAERYGLQARWGWVDLLAGTVSWAEVVQEAGTPRVSVLFGRGAESRDHAPRDFPWPALIEKLKQRYRLTVLDASTLGIARSAPIAAHCDGACLWIRAHQTPRQAAQRAVRALRASGARILGSVLVTGPGAAGTLR